MSLELAIHENTATLKELIGALQSMGKLEIIPVTDKPAPKKAAPKLEQPAAAPAAEAAPEVQEEAAAPITLDYDKDVKPRILLLAGKDRQAVVEMLGRFGVTNAKELQPDQYAQAIADVNRLLAGGAA